MPAFVVMMPMVAMMEIPEVVRMATMVTMAAAMMVVMQMMTAAQPKANHQRCQQYFEVILVHFLNKELSIFRASILLNFV